MPRAEETYQGLAGHQETHLGLHGCIAKVCPCLDIVRVDERSCSGLADLSCQSSDLAVVKKGRTNSAT